MNSISVNIHGYCSKLINYTIMHELIWVIFKQNCVNSTNFLLYIN